MNIAKQGREREGAYNFIWARPVRYSVHSRYNVGYTLFNSFSFSFYNVYIHNLFWTELILSNACSVNYKEGVDVFIKLFFFLNDEGNLLKDAFAKNKFSPRN